MKTEAVEIDQKDAWYQLTKTEHQSFFRCYKDIFCDGFPGR